MSSREPTEDWHNIYIYQYIYVAYMCLLCYHVVVPLPRSGRSRNTQTSRRITQSSKANLGYLQKLKGFVCIFFESFGSFSNIIVRVQKGLYRSESPVNKQNPGSVFSTTSFMKSRNRPGPSINHWGHQKEEVQFLSLFHFADLRKHIPRMEIVSVIFVCNQLDVIILPKNCIKV